MKDSFDKELDFVAGRYDDGKFDTERAIRRFHSSDKAVPRRRWLATAAAAAASVAVVCAAGYGVVKAARHGRASEPAPVQTVVLNPDVASKHVFVYEDAPVEDVLKELSEYFGCTLTTKSTGKHLTATFPDDDLDLIVSIIESVLDIDIVVKR